MYPNGFHTQQREFAAGLLQMENCRNELATVGKHSETTSLKVSEEQFIKAGS